jgi:hypothetical protein
MDEGKPVSRYPATKPAPYDANAKPIITTVAGGKPGRWPGVEVPQIGGWPGGNAKDAGAATKRDGLRQNQAKIAQAGKENKY